MPYAKKMKKKTHHSSLKFIDQQRRILYRQKKATLNGWLYQISLRSYLAKCWLYFLPLHSIINT